MNRKEYTLQDLKDGDIVICYIYYKDDHDWFRYEDGVFNKKDCMLELTSGGTFDFNNHGLCDVRFEFNIIGNVSTNYSYSQNETTLNELLNYLMINKGLDDLKYRINDKLSVDIGHFDEYPVNIVEIREGFIHRIIFSRGKDKRGSNQESLNWLYYLKDKNIRIEI